MSSKSFTNSKASKREQKHEEEREHEQDEEEEEVEVVVEAETEAKEETLPISLPHVRRRDKVILNGVGGTTKKIKEVQYCEKTVLVMIKRYVAKESIFLCKGNSNEKRIFIKNDTVEVLCPNASKDESNDKDEGNDDEDDDSPSKSESEKEEEEEEKDNDDNTDSSCDEKGTSDDGSEKEGSGDDNNNNEDNEEDDDDDDDDSDNNEWEGTKKRKGTEKKLEKEKKKNVEKKEPAKKKRRTARKRKGPKPNESYEDSEKVYVVVHKHTTKKVCMYCRSKAEIMPALHYVETIHSTYSSKKKAQIKFSGINCYCIEPVLGNELWVDEALLEFPSDTELAAIAPPQIPYPFSNPSVLFPNLKYDKCAKLSVAQQIPWYCIPIATVVNLPNSSFIIMPSLSSENDSAGNNPSNNGPSSSPRSSNSNAASSSSSPPPPPSTKKPLR